LKIRSAESCSGEEQRKEDTKRKSENNEKWGAGEEMSKGRNREGHIVVQIEIDR
jgi:hypothetical protein